jgi:hypothetical protein
MKCVPKRQRSATEYFSLAEVKVFRNYLHTLRLCKVKGSRRLPFWASSRFFPSLHSTLQAEHKLMELRACGVRYSPGGFLGVRGGTRRNMVPLLALFPALRRARRNC